MQWHSPDDAGVQVGGGAAVAFTGGALVFIKGQDVPLLRNSARNASDGVPRYGSHHRCHHVQSGCRRQPEFEPQQSNGHLVLRCGAGQRRAFQASAFGRLQRREGWY